MKKIIVIVTALFATVAQAQEQKTVHAFSLTDAVNYAQKNNVQVKNALLDVDIQTQGNCICRLAYH